MSLQKRVALLAAAGAALFAWLWRRRQARDRSQVNALFNQSQMQTFHALTDALIGRDKEMADACGDNQVLREFFLRSASDLKVADLICDALMSFAPPEVVQEFKVLIGALDTTIGTFAMTGNWGRFASLPPKTREQSLQSWSSSRWLTFRKAFVGIRRATALFFFTALPDGKRNPNWSAIQYPGPPPKPASTAPRTFAPEAINASTTLECDAVVCGSGAGGGVCAGELARAGFRVIMLEKGGYFEGADLPHTELHSYPMLYERGCALTTDDGSMSVLAGSCLGGGTVVNWSASLRTPMSVRQEWASKYGCAEVATDMWQHAADFVCSRASVGKEAYTHNANNVALEHGAQKLGIQVTDIPRNCAGCGDERYCGFCQFGCAWGGKQTVLTTHLFDAKLARHPVRILVRAHADRVLLDAATGAACGVAACVYDEAQKRTHSVRINAKLVVAACGSIHTPALLLRSGLKNANIGKHLRLHPVSGLLGEFAAPVQAYLGPMMTTLVDQFANMDGDGYGVRLEMAPVHPGLAASSMPWSSAREFKQTLTKAANSASLIVLTRDKDAGHVTIDETGQPRLHYSISPHDARHLMRGMEIGVRVLKAAGAVRVGTTQQGVAPLALRTPYRAADAAPTGDDTTADAELQAFLAAMHAAGTQPFKAGLFSAHQMGSCRMGGSAAYSVFDSHGECWETPNLFVADASAFPTASGVNPMITTQTLAYFVTHNFMVPRLRQLCDGGAAASAAPATATAAAQRATSNL